MTAVPVVRAVLLGEDAASAAASGPFAHIEDFESERLGAPTRTGLLLEAVSQASGIVQYWGGINLVHVAEMVLGLGVSRVVIGEAMWRSPHSALHFLRVLGDRCVCRMPLSALRGRAEALRDIGAGRVLIDTADWDGLGSELAPIAGSSIKVQLCCDEAAWMRGRNLIGSLPVELEAIVIRREPSWQEAT